MAAETLSRQMQILISSHDGIAVFMKGMISGRGDFSKRINIAQKCYVYEAKFIAAMTTIGQDHIQQ